MLPLFQRLREERRVLNKKVGRLAFLAGLFLILFLVGMNISSVSAHRNLFSDVAKMDVSEAGDAASYVYVTTRPSNQQGILYLANVTAFNGSGAIASGISNTSGVVTLTDIPFGDVTFVAYAGSEFSRVIANQTVLISVEGQSFDLICDRNYGEASVSWSLIVVASLSALIISLPFLLSSCLISAKGNRKTWNNLSKEAGKSQFPRRKTQKKESEKMNILRRKILGPVTLLHLIALSASIAAVSGAAMLYYYWGIELTLAQTDVTFYKWSDGTTANYLELAYNYYAGATTKDENASWGIWNRGVSDKTVYLFAEQPTMATTIDYFYVQIQDDTGTIITYWTTDDWSNTGPAYAVSWNAVAGKIYTLHIILHATLWPDPDEDIVLALRTDP